VQAGNSKYSIFLSFLTWLWPKKGKLKAQKFRMQGHEGTSDQMKGNQAAKGHIERTKGQKERK